MATHLVKHSKLTKRQIKEDPLVTAAFRATAIWEQHGIRILIGAGAVILAGLLVFFISQSRRQAEERASGDVFRATMAVAQGDYPNAIPMLQEIIDNYAGTRAAIKASLLLADSYAAQGKPGEAATSYRDYLKKAGSDRVAQRAGQLGLATVLEDSGEFTPAAQAFGTSAGLSDGENPRGRALLGQARCLLKAGQKERAIEIYRTIAALAAADQPIRDAANFHLGELAGAGSP